MHTRKYMLAAAALALVAATQQASAQKNYGPGVTDSEIKLGQTQPYSGPASAYSVMGRVEMAYFNRLNAEGGVNGRKIKLISLDDGFSPPKAVEMTRQLVESEKVLALFGALGTPPSVAVAKYVNERKVPHLLIASGAPRWGDPKQNPWSTAFYVLQNVEARIYARYILQTKPDARIGVLYPNDDFGKGYLHAFRAALGDKARAMIVKESSYDLTDPTIDSQMIELKNSGADTLFNAATAKFAAQAIRKAADLGWKPFHVLIAASSSMAYVMKPAGLENSKDIITSQFLKMPDDPEWTDDPQMKAYYAFMKQWAPNEVASDATPALAYMTAQLMVTILRNCGDDLSRENVMKQATTLKDMELPLMTPGIKVSYTTDDYTPFRHARMARFDGARWVGFGGLVSSEGSPTN